MAKNKTYTVPHKRKREGKTDYRRRLKLLSSHTHRVIVRSTNNKIIVQAADFAEKGDKTLGKIDTLDLRQFGWQASTGNIPASYLTGYLFAKKFGAKLKEAIIDLGIKSLSDRSRLAAAIIGLADGGMKVKFNERISPTEEDIQGQTIAKYAQSLASDKEKYQKQFSQYIKRKIKPEDLPKMFETTKRKIDENGKGK